MSYCLLLRCFRLYLLHFYVLIGPGQIVAMLSLLIIFSLFFVSHCLPQFLTKSIITRNYNRPKLALKVLSISNGLYSEFVNDVKKCFSLGFSPNEIIERTRLDFDAITMTVSSLDFSTVGMIQAYMRLTIYSNFLDYTELEGKTINDTVGCFQKRIQSFIAKFKLDADIPETAAEFYKFAASTAEFVMEYLLYVSIFDTIDDSLLQETLFLTDVVMNEKMKECFGILRWGEYKQKKHDRALTHCIGCQSDYSNLPLTSKAWSAKLLHSVYNSSDPQKVISGEYRRRQMELSASFVFGETLQFAMTDTPSVQIYSMRAVDTPRLLAPLPEHETLSKDPKMLQSATLLLHLLSARLERFTISHLINFVEQHKSSMIHTSGNLLQTVGSVALRRKEKTFAVKMVNIFVVDEEFRLLLRPAFSCCDSIYGRLFTETTLSLFHSTYQSIASKLAANLYISLPQSTTKSTATNTGDKYLDKLFDELAVLKSRVGRDDTLFANALNCLSKYIRYRMIWGSIDRVYLEKLLSRIYHIADVDNLSVFQF